MDIIVGIENIRRKFRKPVLTLGNFDGVHLGHQKIFKALKEEARKINGEAIVFTFDPHPLQVLAPQTCPPFITPFKKKMMLVEKSGIDVLIVATFDLNLANITPEAFVKQILVNKIGIKKILVGYNYYFGKDRKGNVAMLIRLGEKFGFEVKVIEAIKINDTPVSSSKIRELIQDGKMGQAAQLLGRNYLLIGKVIWGADRGKQLGFPTANLEILNGLYPKTGVYAVEAIMGNKTYPGVANVGHRPTFGKKPLSVEVHILDFSQDIYGEEIQLVFIERIREEKAFENPDSLVRQIKTDVDEARKILLRRSPEIS
ncbi:MAG: bifunctional riboflavin kinase/FAD synthetase [Syntrophobacterales bacterium]|nr:MAG: bifunctional riboflavin kinase/FAD synthetase [Syntrophobacterales bacterium]